MILANWLLYIVKNKNEKKKNILTHMLNPTLDLLQDKFKS